MTNTHDGHPHFEVNSRLLMSGGVLIAVGTALGLLGMALGGTALTAAARHWVKEMEVPPSEIAKQEWARAKAATSAGVSAWRESAPHEAAHSAN
jgi:hypothetical protein